MKRTLSWPKSPDTATITTLEAALLQGGVIAGSSDTILGLLADLTLAGFQELNRIKGRYEKPYLILIADQQKLSHFVQLPLDPQVKRLITECWPGPLTIIFKAKESVPSFMKSAQGTIALRMPRHTGLNMLLAHFDGLFSTSANKAGDPVAQDLEYLDQSIAQAAAYLVRDDAKPENQPSTIIDATGKKLKVIREGAYSVEELQKLIGARIEK